MRRYAIQPTGQMRTRTHRVKKLPAYTILVVLLLNAYVWGAYQIDGSLKDWGVRPGLDWVPDGATADHIVTDNHNTYGAAGYFEDVFDMEALYFDDDARFFYFAFVTKFAFASFPTGAPPVPNFGPKSGGDLGLDFDVSPQGVPNTDVGMDITAYGRVIMKGKPGQSGPGLDYGLRIGSTDAGPLGQVVSSPVWDRTKANIGEYQGGPWKMSDADPGSELGLGQVAFGLEGKSFIVEGAIPRHLFPEAENGGLVGLHITMFCGNDSVNLVGSYSPAPPFSRFVPLSIHKEILHGGSNGSLPRINAGEIIHYLITYANNRNGFPVTDVVLTDPLPAELTFVGMTHSDRSTAYDPGTHSITALLPTLAPGASGSLQVQARLRAEVPDDTLVRNTVSIDSYETDPNTATAEALVYPGPQAPLVVSKAISAGGEDVNDLTWIEVGETLTYTICYTNPNNRAVTNIVLFDRLPAEMSFVSATADGGAGFYNARTHTYQHTLSGLDVGASLCVDVSAQVRPFTPAFTQVINRVTVDSDQTDASEAFVEALVKPIVYQPLNISKQIVTLNGQETSTALVLVEGGDLLTYEVQVDNQSNDHLVQQVTVTDRLSPEVVFVGDDTNQSLGQYDPDTHTYVRSYPSLMPGTGTHFRLSVRIREDVPPETVIRNEVTVTTHETDPNEAYAVAVVKPAPQALGLVKEIASGAEGLPGSDDLFIDVEQTVTYAICFVNGNPDRVLRNIVLTDFLPPEMIFVRATGDTLSGYYDPGAHTYTWTLPSLDPGAGHCVELSARAPAFTPTGTRVVNRARVQSDQTEPVQASAEAVVKRMMFRALDLSKRISAINQVPVLSERPLVHPGNELIYEICLHNRHNAYPIRNLQVLDILPDEVVFIEDLTQPIPGQYHAEDHTYTWETLALAPGAELCIELAVRLRDDTPPGITVTNTVAITGTDIDPETAVAEAIVPMSLQGTMTCSPLILARRGANRSAKLKAVLQLPAGILRNEVRQDSLVLEPGGIPAQSLKVSVDKGKTRLRADFPLAALFQAVSTNGLTTVTVRGRLLSGQTFFAEAKVLLVQDRPL